MTAEANPSPVYATTDDGVRLHCIVHAGPGTALLVIPGITSPAATWEFIAEPLARERAVVTLDVRGRGLSDHPSSGFTLERYADDVAEVVQQLGLDHPVVLGHSMGARIAVAFAQRHPELGGRLIIVDPPLTGPGRDTYPIPLERFMHQLREAREGATADDMAAAYPKWSRKELEVRERWLRTCDETAVRESWLNFHTEDIFGPLHELGGDHLFMYGAESPVVPADVLPEIQTANPRLELVAIPDAAHMLPWENTEYFLAQVSAYLRRLGG